MPADAGTSADVEKRQRALESLRPKLALLHRTVAPSTDPYSAALTALVVVDRMLRADVQDRMGNLGSAFDPHSIDDLRLAALALLELVDQLGGQWIDPHGREISATLREKGEALRASMIAVAERALDDADGVKFVVLVLVGIDGAMGLSGARSAMPPGRSKSKGPRDE
jgi:hypothetical protein